MIIFPAIDIKDGSCVRLYKGDFSTVHKVAEDPLETAKAFYRAGARWVHMVDLDGAKTGRVKNGEIFLQVAEHSGLQVELGGGIRDMHTVAYYLERGIRRVVLGSAAVNNPALVAEAVQKYGDRIAVGIDADNGMVVCEGWLSKSCVHFTALAREMEQAGVKHIVFTDISRDGMLSGPNREQLQELAATTSCRVTASGGIKDLEDIRSLARSGLYGAICGKSLYAGTLDLRSAVELAEKEVG